MDEGINTGDKVNTEADIGNIFTALRTSWSQFDDSGSHLLVQLCNSLAGSQYDGIFKETVALLGPVFACGKSELVLGNLKELESLLRPSATGDTDEETKPLPNKQNVIRCLLLFLKLQAEYHFLCSNLVSSAVDQLSSAADQQTNTELAQQMKTLDLKHHSVPMPTPNSSKHKKLTHTGHSGIGSPKAQKHSQKSSLFSFFARKNSPEEGNSSFYVDIDQQGPESANQGGANYANKSPATVSQSETVPADHMTDKSNVLVDLGLDPSSSECAASSRSPLTAGKNVSGVVDNNGHVASQEELDSVINLLSGAGFGRGTMQTIPEQQNLGNLQVPAFTPSSLSPTNSEHILDDRNRNMTLRYKGQRRSEGSIDVSGFSGAGHNTWPNQHRASLSGQQTVPQIAYDFSMPPPSQQYGSNYSRSTLPPSGAGGNFQTSYGMGFPDPKLKRTWAGVNNLAGPGSVMDTINSSWSGGHDSDELSDDSSTGEAGQTLSHLQLAENRLDMFKDVMESPYNRVDARQGDVKHHSLEDLLDARSNTWPQQLQPWPQLRMDLIGPQDHMPDHRPISMQMSDPLSRRNILQDPGADFPIQSHGPQQSQSVQGGLGQL